MTNCGKQHYIEAKQFQQRQQETCPYIIGKFPGSENVQVVKLLIWSIFSSFGDGVFPWIAHDFFLLTVNSAIRMQIFHKFIVDVEYFFD